MSVSRLWLAAVILLFCLPLFVGLRSVDLETDEAIYSFAVDRILEIGQWLEPKSSPSETAVFLEKPPLKFWIVAAPIRAGLLPHDELGLRFWDALFGGLAFVYVFAIGSRLAGPVCGVVAVLLLFVHWPLLLEHGIRGNNMESALLLAYCGGTFHFMEWMRDRRRAGRHAAASGLYFALGFMTKFVAVVFLPAVLGLSALLFSKTRRRLIARWRTWLAVAGLVVAIAAPWFVYAQIRFGSLLWHTMLAEHVYARFTTGLNVEHVHPWNYYFLQMDQWFARAAAAVEWAVVTGMIVLLVQTVRRRSFDGTVVLLWGTLPLALISLGSSKLYHYAYPFLPPLTIAAGYVAALVMMLAPALVRRAGEAVEGWIASRAPTVGAAFSRPAANKLAVILIWLAGAIGVWAVFVGQTKLAVGSTVLFKSSGIVRPIAVILLAGIVARRSGRVAVLVTALAVGWWLPITFYKQTLPQLVVERHPLRDTSDCIRRVEASLPAGSATGLYVDTDSSMWHPIYYYFRRIQPWTRQEAPAPAALARILREPEAMRPSLVQELRYRGYTNGPDAALFRQDVSPPMIGLLEYVLLLPGPYAACSSEAALRPGA